MATFYMNNYLKLFKVFVYITSLIIIISFAGFQCQQQTTNTIQSNEHTKESKLKANQNQQQQFSTGQSKQTKLNIINYDNQTLTKKSLQEKDILTPKATKKDFRWPNRQLNVLVDLKSFNQSELQILSSLFDQIEHKTCIKIKHLNETDNEINYAKNNGHLLLSDLVQSSSELASENDGSSYKSYSDMDDESKLNVAERLNYLYIFKSKMGHFNRHPSLGLSSFGCVRQGRQSMILTELAFKWPELILRYHILRSLGIESLERPDNEVKHLLNMLPLSQKIAQEDNLNLQIKQQEKVKKYFQVGESLNLNRNINLLNDDDLSKLKQLYQCKSFQNKLSVKPLSELNQDSSFTKLDSKSESKLRLESAEQSIEKLMASVDSSADHKANESLIDEAAKNIVDYLLSSELKQKLGAEAQSQSTSQPNDQQPAPAIETDQQLDESLFKVGPSANCDPMQYCPLGSNTNESSSASKVDQESQERPMILKLDDYNAQDPQLKLANQMKLTQLANATYRLMGAPEWQPSPAGPQPSQAGPLGPARSEMLISFEQIPTGNQGNPVAALAGAQLLKLCSCTCQTMGPQPGQTSTDNTHLPVTDGTSEAPATTMTPSTSPEPTTTTTTTTTTTPPPTTPMTTMTTTMTTTSTTTLPPPPPPPPTTPTPIITSQPETSTPINNVCDSVQWVKPNKTVYASARIVWDVDRANQNYFICNNFINGELVPGKTHGFSCKVSNEGKSYEMHDFNVLTKPESVNLAWVQKNSDSFGKSNFPVVGGISKSQDPYIVSRCLVRDENNDLITLIGYVTNRGGAWFPFDDIQIECDQYDILACVN